MTTIRVAQAVQLLYAKDWGPGCLANTDLVNPVFFGHSRSLDSSSDQIPGLGAIPVDGSRDIYGSTLASGVSVAVQSMPGVTNWAPSPAQVSAQISALGLMRDTTGQSIGTNTGNVHTDLALGTNQFLSGAQASAIAGAGSTVAKDVAVTGAPLLGFKNVLGSNAAGLAVPANTNTNLLTNAAISQIGYEMLFTVSTAAGTVSGAFIFVSWSDSVTGLVTDSQTWSFFSGTNAAPHSIKITGPFNGDRVTVIFGARANALTVKYTIMQASRFYKRHFGHTLTPQGVAPAYPGLTAANGDPSSGILASESQAVAAASAANLILPLYSGTARLWGTGSLNTGTDNEWRLTYSSSLITLNDTLPYRAEGGQGFSPFGNASIEIDNIAMPRTQMGLALKNNNATTVNTMTCHLIAREMQT